MNRGELRQEIKDLGHNYGTTGWDTRIDRFLNLGAKDILHDQSWPQRRVVVPGVVPGAVVPRLGAIKQVLVTSTQQALDPVTVDELRDGYGGPIPTGSEPLYYYSVNNLTLAVAPAGPTPIDVDHFDRACWTDAAGLVRKIEATADTDLLVAGDIFEEAVLIAARLRVLEDSDEVELRESLTLRLRGGDGMGGVMGQLRDRQLLIDSDEPQRIKQTYDWA